jgi:hypothetical protein
MKPRGKMKTQKTSKLCCPACESEGLFVQVMDHVENLVDSDANHLHLLLGIPDFYVCRECGERFYWGE